MSDQLPPEFWQGVEQFNQRQFYACHDTLEALWMEALEPEKTFYQGVLQIAVALYHLENQNLRGAIILLGEGMNRLRHYQPAFAGIDVAQLLAEARALQANLQQISLQYTNAQCISGEQLASILNQANLDGGLEFPEIKQASDSG